MSPFLSVRQNSATSIDTQGMEPALRLYYRIDRREEGSATLSPARDGSRGFPLRVYGGLVLGHRLEKRAQCEIVIRGA